MSQQARPINQHWVPQFYLRYFATPETRDTIDGARAWFWDKRLKRHSSAPTSIKKFLAERHLYSPENPDGERDWSAEDLLDQSETGVGEIWPTVLSREASIRDPAVRRPLARFIGLLHLRNVRLRNLMASTMKLRDQLFGPLTAEQLSERSPDMPDPNHAGRMFSHTLLNGDDRMTSAFLELNWFFFWVKEDVFVATDTPVTFVQGGPGRENTAAVCPLSPRALLVMQNLKDVDVSDGVEITSEKARAHNKEIYS